MTDNAQIKPKNAEHQKLLTVCLLIVCFLLHLYKLGENTLNNFTLKSQSLSFNLFLNLCFFCFTFSMNKYLLHTYITPSIVVCKVSKTKAYYN